MSDSELDQDPLTSSPERSYTASRCQRLMPIPFVSLILGKCVAQNRALISELFLLITHED